MLLMYWWYSRKIALTIFQSKFEFGYIQKSMYEWFVGQD